MERKGSKYRVHFQNVVNKRVVSDFVLVPFMATEETDCSQVKKPERFSYAVLMYSHQSVSNRTAYTVNQSHQSLASFQNSASQIWVRIQNNPKVVYYLTVR